MKQITTLRQSWVWREKVIDFVKDRIKGHSLNVCAGKNLICDVNLDADTEARFKGQYHLREFKGEFVQGDMNDLPFDDESFDTVVSDPPWRIGYYQRPKPFFECVRVCKIGGTIIYNAYHIPTSKLCKLKETVIRTDYEWGNASIISVFERIR